MSYALLEELKIVDRPAESSSNRAMSPLGFVMSPSSNDSFSHAWITSVSSVMNVNFMNDFMFGWEKCK